MYWPTTPSNGEFIKTIAAKQPVITDGFDEDAIKAYLKRWLEDQGWSVKVAWGKNHGVDIEAIKDGEYWLIEAKGPGSRQAMQHNYFLGTLGETLQRMENEKARYSIAFPDMPVYRGLWRRLPTLAKQRTGIDMLLVAEDGKVALTAFVVIDYLTGLMCASLEKKLSSEVGFRGIFRKVLIFALVGVGHIIDKQIIGDGSVLRTAVIFFYLSNEGIIQNHHLTRNDGLMKSSARSAADFDIRIHLFIQIPCGLSPKHFLRV